ncbi:hypothetical protein ACFV06_33495 [Streptomyces sp. NPDC059618]|uniref:hypothetical protein n=1 Tax=Streptomyces sp. NPDC059618 TaxID=3346887 RepID=UPI003687AACC
MKRPGPLLTLLAGLVFGVLLLVLDVTTGSKGTSNPYRPASPGVSVSATVPAASASPSASPPPSASPSRTAAPSGAYAGRTDDGTSAIAFSLRDGKVVAYFCDGHAKESWLKGDVADDGSMRLTGGDGDELNGTLRDHRLIHGSADVGGQRYGFTADRAVRPSGLYRATATVRGAKVDGGWIVLPGGKQVGVVERDGTPAAAPSIDPETGAVTVDGQKITARPVTP